MIKTHASLFSGIGAAEIAADWMGWQSLFHCEIQEFPRRVLEYWYPNAVSYEDITKTDFTSWMGKIDILTAGFPCQPFSCAGQRRGTDDDRYLWPETLRAIREIQPSWFVGENVTGLLSMVQPGEDVKMGRTDDLFEENYIYRKEQRFTLDEICEGLERAGYAVQPFVIPACAVGAPHRRDRVWIVARLAADTDSDRQRHGQGEQEPIVECERTPDNSNGRKKGLVADTLRTGRQELNAAAEPREALLADSESDARRLAAHADEYGHTPCWEGKGAESGGRRHVPQPCERRDEAERADGLPRLQRSAADTRSCGRYACELHNGELEKPQQAARRAQQPLGTDCPQDWWRDFPTQSPVCSRDDELSARLAGITFPRWRTEAIKALGNAWVPAVAYEIFRAIAQVDNETENDNEYETTHTAAG